MPHKPKHPCYYPGCPRLTDSQYCEEHRKKMNREYEKHGRDPETKKRYGRAWEKIRKLYVQTHPFCEECYKSGVLVPLEHVHHTKPLSEGGTNDFDNLESLCLACHSRLHGERGDRWNRRR